MKVLVTGTAGFIGYAVAEQLLQQGHAVLGYDNHNDYYDPALKAARVARLAAYENYRHCQADIVDNRQLQACFQQFTPEKVIHLAAQAGVRYSVENPMVYMQSNVLGFMNILECCRQYQIQHLVYASSSSVYGGNAAMPFSTQQNTDHPLSIYAASKKSNELMAHSYSHLYQLPSTGLRFFTVYGPWGRPDMALFKFTKAILADEPITLFNFGRHKRDFTYITDIVAGILHVLAKPATAAINWDPHSPDPSCSSAPWRLYNMGNNCPVDLLEYVAAIEDALGKKAQKEYLPLQQGDVLDTYADVSDLVDDFAYQPKTPITDGVALFVNWYKEYYGF